MSDDTKTRVNYMDLYTTLTGYTMSEALNKMKEMLPPDAYAPVKGTAVKMTDIDPAYLTEVVTEVFGACGLGWKFDYTPDDLTIEAVTKEKRDGGTYQTYQATIKSLDVYYAVMYDGVVRWSDAVQANGGNENENAGYAARGALTNAIGAAFSKLLWQLGVYKGIITHENAAQLWATKQARLKAAEEKKNGNSQPTTAAITDVKATPEAMDAKAIVEEAMQTLRSVGSQEPEPAPVPQAAAPVEKTIEWAESQVVPEGLPGGGKTLGDNKSDNMLGYYIIKWLAGGVENAAGKMYTPQVLEEVQLQEAAKMVLATLPAPKKKK